MKTTLYYFSGTGNSLYVAKTIQEKLGDTELIPITSKLRDSNMTIEADMLGFVFPVYAWGPPAIVEEFLNTMQVQKSEYLFVVATHGGGPENALKRFENILRKKGLSIDSAFDIKMVGNYVIGSDIPSKEEIQQILNKVESGLSDILAQIARRAKISIPGGKFPGTLKTTVIHPLFSRMIKKQDKKFYASDTCTGCGICEKLCPVENIILNTEKKPEWQHRCESCLACIHWCPEQAIEYGSATLQRNRYHHPEIRVSELFRK